MARFTRHELKQDELRTTYEHFEQFVKERYKDILAGVGLLVAVVGLVASLKIYANRQEAEASAQLYLALRTFHAYVGIAAPGTFGPDAETFPTAQAKYKKALDQFTEITRKFPRQKVAALARYHMGLCQGQLGEQAAALKTLEEASRYSDRAIAALAELALAGELARSGKLQEAARHYQNLADHPTSTVPRATALLEMADAYRASQPAQARQLYERMQKEFGSDVTLAQVLKQQIESLPR